MNTQTKHTPTPYAVGDKSKDEDSAMVYSNTNDGAIYDGVRVADCNTDMFLSKKQSEINAEFIVRACNNHYELLEALIKCTQYVRNNSSGTKDFDDTLDVALSAIAKARG